MRSAAPLAFLTVLAASAAGAGACAASEDRYGPPPPADMAAPVAAPPVSGWLSWSSKTPAPVVAPPTRAAVRAEPSRFEPAADRPQPERTASAAPLPTSLYAAYPPPQPRAGAPAAPWTSLAGQRGAMQQASGQQASGQQPSAQPAPIQQPPLRQAQASATPPHFYSVHRQFGLTPDPIPLPQQFFAGGSADLAAAPPPLPPKPVPGTQAATSPANTASNRAREVELETADSAN